ncbi:GNAT family N-acetyltransferase [Azospirillum sp. SYSU D00513]|uniref:GNAT family N-acetyltransferase n=1 Tax=Azospirillum sp. SYSU D00513 TaxID=2812561 RepID=UPI001A97C9B0|nr:GNAT family N-acetyltransferase [Azospirillum sp. SYSU D00513]
MPSAEAPPRRPIRIEPLSRRHRTASFSCGNRRIDQYLAQGHEHQDHNLGRLFVALDKTPGAADVLGYYAVHNSSIKARHVPNPLGAMLHREAEVGALYVVMFGVDRSCQRRGIGTAMLMDVLRRTRRVNMETAVWAVILDPLDASAEAFYRTMGFDLLDAKTRRMFLQTKDIPIS